MFFFLNLKLFSFFKGFEFVLESIGTVLMFLPQLFGHRIELVGDVQDGFGIFDRDLLDLLESPGSGILGAFLEARPKPLGARLEGFPRLACDNYWYVLFEVLGRCRRYA